MREKQIEVLKFQQAVEKNQANGKKAHLLLGNGFSMAFNKDIFAYDSLLEQAKSQDLFKKTSDAVPGLFDKINTSDFEHIMLILRHTQTAIPFYGADPGLISNVKQDAESLKKILIETITKNHPDTPSSITDEQYDACYKFLNNFNTIYSLNYDLLLYWVILKFIKEVKLNDGFYDASHGKTSLGEYHMEDYVVWFGSNNAEKSVYYLHGALHLYDAGYELRKYCWSRTGIKLKDQMLDALEKDMFPLFVAEGDSKSKLAKIIHSEYLSKGRRSLSKINGVLFVFGLGFKDNDKHIMDAIIDSTISDIYIGLYGDPLSLNNKLLIKNINKMIETRNQLVVDRKKKINLNAYFYDAASAKVWGS